MVINQIKQTLVNQIITCNQSDYKNVRMQRYLNNLVEVRLINLYRS